jgi:hypothetical protein
MIKYKLTKYERELENGNKEYLGGSSNTTINLEQPFFDITIYQDPKNEDSIIANFWIYKAILKKNIYHKFEGELLNISMFVNSALRKFAVKHPNEIDIDNYMENNKAPFSNNRFDRFRTNLVYNLHNIYGRSYTNFNGFMASAEHEIFSPYRQKLTVMEGIKIEDIQKFDKKVEEYTELLRNNFKQNNTDEFKKIYKEIINKYGLHNNRNITNIDNFIDELDNFDRFPNKKFEAPVDWKKNFTINKYEEHAKISIEIRIKKNMILYAKIWDDMEKKLKEHENNNDILHIYYNIKRNMIPITANNKKNIINDFLMKLYQKCAELMETSNNKPTNPFKIILRQDYQGNPEYAIIYADLEKLGTIKGDIYDNLQKYINEAFDKISLTQVTPKPQIKEESGFCNIL